MKENIKRNSVLILSIILVMLAAWTRFFLLGRAALRADTILFYQAAHKGVSPFTLWNDWIGVMGATGQFPLSTMLSQALVVWCKLPITEAVLRLPFAFFGTLSVVLCILIGRRIGGNVFGLIAGLAITLSPFHIQLSRECYFYGTLLFGTALLLFGMLEWFFRRHEKTPLPWWIFAVVILGHFFSSYSHLTGWFFSFTSALLTLYLLALRFHVKSPDRHRVLIVIGISYAVVLLPLLFIKWALPYFISTHNASHAEYTELIFGKNNPIGSLGHVFLAMQWGQTPMRMVFTLLISALALFYFIRGDKKKRDCLAVLGLFLLLGVSLMILSALRSRYPIGLRHMSFLFPIIVMFMAAGLYAPYEWLKNKNWKPLPKHGLSLLLPFIFVCFAVPPSWAAMMITGKPTPYKKIREWADTQAPRDALILVDRWFEPWNELLIYKSTNATFTFTVPDEPLSNFTNLHWRTTAMNFFVKYPDAVFMEIQKNHWQTPGIGPWHWPRQYFKQHATIRNEHGIYLREQGLSYREGGGPYTNRLVIDIFWNTREDVLEKARHAGTPYVLFYGQGWGYDKFWQRTGDFRDWRILTVRGGTFDIYNVREQPLTNVVLSMTGVAMGSHISLAHGHSTLLFPQQKYVRQTLKPMRLEPGKNTIPLKVLGAPEAVLLVDNVF